MIIVFFIDFKSSIFLSVVGFIVFFCGCNTPETAVLVFAPNAIRVSVLCNKQNSTQPFRCGKISMILEEEH